MLTRYRFPLLRRCWCETYKKKFDDEANNVQLPSETETANYSRR